MTRFAACCLLGLILVACGDEPVAPPQASPPAARALDEAAVEQLRALGYADFALAQDGERSGVTLWQRDAAEPGYSLFSNRNLCSAALIDNAGAIQNF